MFCPIFMSCVVRSFGVVIVWLSRDLFCLLFGSVVCFVGRLVVRFPESLDISNSVAYPLCFLLTLPGFLLSSHASSATLRVTRKAKKNITSRRIQQLSQSCVVCFFGTHVVILVAWKFVVFDCLLLFFVCVLVV